ncbi:MAG: hypothetical protein SNJ58_13795 [Aggregatilineales bacterium]
MNLDIYERLPLPIRGWIRHSVFLTLATSTVSLLVLLLIPDEVVEGVWLRHGFWHAFFGVLEQAQAAVDLLLDFAAILYPHLIVLNAFNLLSTMALLTFTLGTLRGGSEPVQALIAANAVPSVLSIVSTCIIIGLFIAVAVATLVTWTVIITIYTI